MVKECARFTAHQMIVGKGRTLALVEHTLVPGAELEDLNRLSFYLIQEKSVI